MRGRPRKAQINEVVKLPGFRYGTIVDYRSDVASWRYLIVESDGLGKNPRGAAVWYDSTEFETLGRKSKRPGIKYRQNKRAGTVEERGCACQCCPHVAGFEVEPED